MKIVAQIDGLSGTGKSSLAAELSRRGYCAVDSDDRFAYFGNPTTGEPTAIRSRDHWIWDIVKVRAFCAESRPPTFICGGAMNQEHCADLFTHRFLLRIDDRTLRHRLSTRTTNDFGKDLAELAEQLRLNRHAEDWRRRAGWIVVDATQPLTDVADAILRGIR